MEWFLIGYFVSALFVFILMMLALREDEHTLDVGHFLESLLTALLWPLAFVLALLLGDGEGRD